VDFALYRDAFRLRDGSPAGPAAAALEADLAAGRLAGIVFLGNPWPLKRHGAIQRWPVPAVSIMGRPDPDLPAMGALVHEGCGAFLRRALGILAAAGRTKVALLGPEPAASSVGARDFTVLAREQGIQTRRWWYQRPDLRATEWVANCVELLMRSEPADRPDGLILMDDHLCHPAALGLAAAHVTVPEDLTVVAHANFPLRADALLPFERLGYDAREGLAAAVKWMRGCREDGRVPAAPAARELHQRLHHQAPGAAAPPPRPEPSAGERQPAEAT
jgi:DNA-binding LacI/PurR family transcriptional regulator